MKALQKILAAAAALLLCLSLGESAFASSAGEPASAWDAIMAGLAEKYGAGEDDIAAGYLNLATGEEHYLNPDRYMSAADMYMLPLCMYYTEAVSGGVIDWSPYEQYFSFESLRDKVLIDSDREIAEQFCNWLGGREAFRDIAAPYLGVEAGTEPAGAAADNSFTAREFICCLRLLYEEQARFPGIIEAMQKAEPKHYFRLDEPRFSIAHKYGRLDSEPNWMNDCGICRTTQPIAIVLFTRGLQDPESFLTEYCTAVCEYTERLANTPPPTPEATALPAPAPSPAAASQPGPAAVQVPDRAPIPMPVPAVCVGLFALFGLIFIIVLCVKNKIRFIGLFLALVLSAGAMLLAVAGVYMGTVYAKPSGSPAESVTRFFDAVCAGNYSTAYAELRDYSDLGLAESPSSPAGQKIYGALHASFAYTLAGECRTDKLEAVQPVRFRYLDLAVLERAVADETQRQIGQIVQERPTNQVYDQDRRYRPEVAEEAYLKALDVVLQNAPSYYTEAEFDLSLAYTDSRWQILASPALLRALAGGIGY